ncbi:MAG: hypothetical protein HYW07_11970 [Candidatus Latescibacteria bacterium]|nr:hypothetical protein [Candidatus Latescibacterota bacterium]
MLLTAWHPTTQATVDTLALRSQPPVSADLLVVAKTISLGDLRLFAVFDQAAIAPAVIFALRSQPAMAPDLLVMARTITRGASLASTPVGLADQAPLANDYTALTAI